MSTGTLRASEPISKTPYLDRQLQLPRPNRRHSRIKSWQAILLLASLLLETIRVACLIWMLVILIHELGHLAGGLLVGDKFDYIRIGALRIDRVTKIKWELRWGTILTGATRTLPTSKTGLRWRLCFSTLCGPASNLLSGCLALSVLKFASSDDSLLLACTYVFIAQSFIAGFANLFPVVRHGWMSDGMRVSMLLFSRKKSERLISILRFVADVKKGDESHLLESHEVGKWASVKDQTADQVIANWAAYRRANNTEEEARYLDNCLAACSATTPEFREELVVEAARFQVLRRKRVDLAREWLAADKSGKRRLNRYFAEGLVLDYEGEIEQAIGRVDEALTYIATGPDTPLRTKQENAFKKWRLELQEKLSGKAEKQPEVP
jgi:hypothetical protein